jgi:hypothetical protein
MPVPHHADVELVAGDDWVIPFLLTDSTGSPLDLSSAVLSWMLLDPDANPIADLNPTIGITAPPTAGTGTITVANTVTTLSPGRYTDAMRVSITGAVSTLWIGQILVDANPFAEPAPVPAPVMLADPVFIVPPWWWIYGGNYY